MEANGIINQHTYYYESHECSRVRLNGYIQVFLGGFNCVTVRDSVYISVLVVTLGYVYLYVCSEWAQQQRSYNIILPVYIVRSP